METAALTVCCEEVVEESESNCWLSITFGDCKVVLVGAEFVRSDPGSRGLGGKTKMRGTFQTPKFVPM